MIKKSVHIEMYIPTEIKDGEYGRDGQKDRVREGETDRQRGVIIFYREKTDEQNNQSLFTIIFS